LTPTGRLSPHPRRRSPLQFGQTHAGLHLYGEAVREYRQATRLKSDDPAIYFDLGSALTRLAQYDEAAGAFQKCLDLDPENYRAQDALEEARDGSKRIKTARKYQEDQLKKQKEEEEKKQGTPGSATDLPKTPSI
jgi:Flp pilus assembly protein TadD